MKFLDASAIMPLQESRTPILKKLAGLVGDPH